ncbi:MAG: hypothetical protein WCV88_03105 [Patescibacteria group bacterium]
MIWFLTLLFPLMAQAVSLPQPSDVVLLHDGQSDEQQTRYNYVFTLANDATIYTCQGNRCSLTPFREQASVDATFYQLPEGYPRVANLTDQTILQSYQQAAVAQYSVTGLATALEAGDKNRSYHTINIKADGSYTSDAVTQERNKPIVLDDTNAVKYWPWVVGGVIGVLLILSAGYYIYRKRL